MKTWKLLSGLFTLMSSFFVGFSGLVLGLDQAFKHESDKGESDGIFLAFFMFFGGLVSIFLRKSKVGGNIAIIILHAIIALIGFQSDATKYHIVGAWGLLCAAIAAYSLYQHYRGDKQTKEATTNKQVQKVMSNRQCPYCHAAVPSGSAFCGSCGKELPKEIVCPQCGASVDVNAQFCSNCGKNLSTDSVEEAVTSQSETVYEEEGENPIRKYLPYILGAIALIVICGGGWWYFNSSKAPQSNNEAAVAEAVEADTIVTEADVDDVATNTIQNNGVERPSVQKLGNLFNEMETGKLTALKDYGFTLKDKQKKMILSNYAEEGDEADIELIKEVYSLNYKMGNPSEMSDGFMKIVYVYAKEYGEPSMEIECDEKTWNELKFEAESSLKNSMGNSYILNMNSYINFIHEGAITVSTENSITWE